MAKEHTITGKVLKVSEPRSDKAPYSFKVAFPGDDGFTQEKWMKAWSNKPSCGVLKDAEHSGAEVTITFVNSKSTYKGEDRWDCLVQNAEVVGGASQNGTSGAVSASNGSVSNTRSPMGVGALDALKGLIQEVGGLVGQLGDHLDDISKDYADVERKVAEVEEFVGAVPQGEVAAPFLSAFTERGISKDAVAAEASKVGWAIEEMTPQQWKVIGSALDVEVPA